MLGQEFRYVTATEGREVRLDCNITRGLPLPTFQWYHQKLFCSSNPCEPDANKWGQLPINHSVYPPANVPAAHSRVVVQSANENAFYKCVASNWLGKDNTVIKLLANPGKVESIMILL